MRMLHSHWLLVSILIAPLVSIAALAPQATQPATKAADPGPTAAGVQSAQEKAAQKQRDGTIAAMQSSIDKQRASVAKGLAASVGKQAGPITTTAGGSFFNLPPLAPPPPPVTPETAMPAMSEAAALPDVVCDPVPEASIAPILLEAAQREGLEPRLLTAVIQQESAFRPCAISHKGAQGLMQLMPDTATQFGVKDPFDPKQNVDAGAKYLKELISRYSGNLAVALGAYNAGPAKVDEAGGVVPSIPETTDYVSQILSRLADKPATPTQ